ncbi:MAG TPA: CPBP family glutamic-type intramembrane protease [Polyangia bacterium]|nr:CPBP family glutamic-type intramembrane protease [Polyangia bacterium]
MSDAESSVLAPRRKAPRRGTALAAFVLLAVSICGAPGIARAQAPAFPPRAAPVPAELLARAASPDVGTRQAAIAALRALGTPAAIELELAMLQRDIDPRVRAAAAAALGDSHDPALDPALAYASLADPDPIVRAFAAGSRAALAPFAKRPKLAAGLSLLCPGCGYFYLGRPERAAAFLGAGAVLLASGLVVLDESPLVLHSDGTVGHDDGRATPLLISLQNLWFYGVFASYRDARLARGDLGARFPVAKEGLSDLLVAPFNPRVLKSPWVWAGLPAMLGAAVGASYVISHATSNRASVALRTLSDGGGVQFFGDHYPTAEGFALGEAYNTTMFLPVAVGEESLFRGAVQAGLSESLGLWQGWALGSAIFGAAHTFNFIGDDNGVKEAAYAVPYLMLTGSYLGYLYIRSDFSLLRGVAVHFWYDFLLATIDFIEDPDHQPFVLRFGMPF